jgi:cation diffusion facilitator family transporter
MQHAHASDRATARGALQPGARGFDFGELGHLRKGTVRIDSPRGARQTSAVTNTGHSPTPADVRAMRAPAVRRTLLIILALNAVVVLVKLAVGLRTGALAVLGSALESGLDLLNNFVGIVLTRVASLAPDENHPYGHEKFETLGTLAIVGFLSISCFELLREAVRHALARESVRVPSLVELALIVATMAANLFVVWYERRRGTELRSTFLLADAAHTRADIYVTAAALASLLLTRLGFAAADPVLAILVALSIAWSGYEILRGTVPVLVDARAVEASEIRRVVSAVPRVADVRTVRSRATASGCCSRK